MVIPYKIRYITVFILFNVYTDIFEILLNIDNNDRLVDF